MGIFNEQSFDHPFAKGIQGAPGVGFNLTSDGNYDMNKKRLTNVGDGVSPSDAVTRKQLDSSGVGDIKADINLKYSYNIKNSKERTFDQLKADVNSLVSYEEVRENFIGINEAEAMKTYLDMGKNFIYNVKTPTANDQAANKSYVDTTATNTMNAAALIHATKQELANYLKKDGTDAMTGNLNMTNNEINNLPAPNGPTQPTPLAFTDLKYLRVAGTNKMTNNLNMDNKGIINLKPPTSNTDAATKKYVDDNSGSPDLSDYLEKDGTVPMTGELNLGGNKIINLSKPLQNNDAANKDYVDKLVHSTAVQPSHYKDRFSYLMSSSNQWTDEVDGGNSFNITKIGELPPSNGNFHDYNHKVLYMSIYKNSQGGYKFKMAINFYRLVANADYTLCLELLNTDYQLWHKSQISVDKGTSSGLSIGNVSVNKLSHSYTDSKGQSQFIYYHRMIVNFKKLSSGNKFFLHIVNSIPQAGTDLAVYPRQFSKVYMIAYGIVGTVSNIDPDKTYDYHTAFDIKPTQVVYNVDINANQQAIKNVKLDQSSDNNVATIGLVKTLITHIYNNLYREIFEEYYDFSDASIYGISSSSSGVIINSFKPNITIPDKHLSIIKNDGININGYSLTFNPSNHSSQYTLCIVFTHGRNRKLYLKKIRRSDGKNLTLVEYDTSGHVFALIINDNVTTDFTIPSSFNGKKIVIWLTENFNSNVAKLKISNYASSLTLNSTVYANDQYWAINIDDGVIYRIMSSPKFYDFDSDEYKKVMIQEKLNGSYIV